MSNMDEEMRQIAQNVALLVMVCLILGAAVLIGTIFGFGFGVAALFLLTAAYLYWCLMVYAKSAKKGADHDRD